MSGKEMVTSLASEMIGLRIQRKLMSGEIVTNEDIRKITDEVCDSINNSIRSMQVEA